MPFDISNSAWGGSWGESWGESWSVVATVPSGGPARYGLIKKKKKKQLPQEVIDRLLAKPEPGLTPAEIQAFAEQEALRQAEQEALRLELLRIQEHQALLLREDEELVWLLMSD